MTTTTNPIVKAVGIHKSFGATQALQGVSLDLIPGEIHALVGENGAGKSTMINILSGVFPPDEGEIFIGGVNVELRSTRRAQELGVGSVHQELALCPAISVAENIFMGQAGHTKGLVRYSRMFDEASELLEQFGAGIGPRHRADQLSIAQQQVVEIVKALSCNCGILILDEPTSSLTDSESETLFSVIRDLREHGIAILYVSHRMSEIFDLSDRITVLRDGHHVDTVATHDVEPQTIIQKMVGRKLSAMYPTKRSSEGPVILEARGLSREGVFKDISFELHEGEVLGFSGLVGAGRTEVARAACGIDPLDAGEVLLNGTKLQLSSYESSIDAGLVYLPEDRKLAGLFLGMDIQQNLSAACLDRVSQGGFINLHKERVVGEKYSKTLDIRLRDLRQLARELSGGNQQKTMVAKWLATEPKVIIMDEPTRGIDVGAKAEIYGLIDELVRNRIGVIVISSELPEIIGMCDRVLVMYEGSCMGMVTGEEINEERIMTLAAPHKNGQSTEDAGGHTGDT